MSKYVCEQISTENPQMCLAWVEQSSFADLLNITYADANILLAQVIVLLATAYLVNVCADAFQSRL
jgi:hypothetical protein